MSRMRAGPGFRSLTPRGDVGTCDGDAMRSILDLVRQADADHLCPLRIPGPLSAIDRIERHLPLIYATPPYTGTNADNAVLRYALAHIHFSNAHTPEPPHAVLRHVRTLREKSSRILIVTGLSRRLAKESHHGEMKRVLETYRSRGCGGRCRDGDGHGWVSKRGGGGTSYRRGCELGSRGVSVVW
jgi:hypothetical protein